MSAFEPRGDRARTVLFLMRVQGLSSAEAEAKYDAADAQQRADWRYARLLEEEHARMAGT